MPSLLVLPLVALLSVAQTGPSVPEPLSEIEYLRRQVVYLQDQLNGAITAAETCQANYAPYRRQRDDQVVAAAKADLKTRIEAAHPCCTFDPDTGVLRAKPDSTPTEKPAPEAPVKR